MWSHMGFNTVVLEETSIISKEPLPSSRQKSVSFSKMLEVSSNTAVLKPRWLHSRYGAEWKSQICILANAFGYPGG